MIYKFLIISDEADNFFREISIDSDATFLDLQNSILESVNYSNDQITSFFICEDDWEKKTEITLMEMDSSSENDSWIMEDTRLSELLEDEKQKLLFVFDMIADRAFFMELHEIITGKNLKKAVCTQSSGEAPLQIADFSEIEKTISSTELLDENFYGDESFNPDELDEDGFNDLDISDDSAFNEPDRF